MIASFLKTNPLARYKKSKNKSLTNIKSLKQKGAFMKTNKNKFYNNNISNILNFEKKLIQKEKKFRTNISNQIIQKRDLSQKIYNNVALLENKIINSYNSLKSSNYSYNKTNNNILNGLCNKKRFMILNKEYDNYIYKIKNDISQLENKIIKYDNLTELYEKDYNDTNNQVIELKKECKILPEMIDNLENENRNLNNLCININSNIMKIKYDLLELDKNKKNIQRYLYQIDKLYKLYE